MIDTLVSSIQRLAPPYGRYGGTYLLSAAAAALALAVPWLWPAGDRVRRHVVARTMWWLLAWIVAATATVAYLDFFQPPYGRYANPYELFHYYLGAKYAPEIGYDGLYEAALVADAETGRFYRPADGAVRDLATNAIVPAEAVLADHVAIRSRFSFARWSEFTADVVALRERLGPDAWNRVLHDRGYNATPAWTYLLARPLASLAPATDARAVLALSLLDLALLVLAVAMVRHTFGDRPAVLLVALCGSFYLMAHAHMKGALLRTDFAVALVLAVCALAKGRAATAGALVGMATLSRVFPAVFLFGPVVLAVTTSRTKAWRLLAAWSVTVVAGVALSTAIAGDLGVWREFARKIAVHRELPHIWNLGFDALLHADTAGRTNLGLPPGVARSSSGTPAMLHELEAARTILGWIVKLVAVAVAALVARRLALHRALAFGFVPFFFLVAPTYYYWIVILLPFLFFAEKPERTDHAAGIALLYLFGAVGFACYAQWDQYFATTFWCSATGGLVAAYVTWVAYRDQPTSR